MAILLKPIITEKSLKDAQGGIFTFEVGIQSTKNVVKKEVEKLFSVHVQHVTTVIRKGKIKVSGKQRKEVKKPNIKIARAKLAKGEKIDLFTVGKST